MKTVIYGRVSTLLQAQQQTIEQQMERLSQYAESAGIESSEIVTLRDEGYSGASLKRPGLSEMRARAKQGEVARVWSPPQTD